jgi:hypothetical protein
VIVLVPAVTPVTNPVVLTVATVGVLEVQVTSVVSSVRFSVSPLVPATPKRTNWLCWPEEVSDTLDGVNVKDVTCSTAPAETVNVPMPVITA